MRVRVISNFVDKYTKTLHKKGEILEMTKERCREINGASYGNLVEEVQDGGTNDYLDKYTVTEEYLSSMTKKELVELAKEKDINLNMRMTQKEMIEELI